MAFNKQENINTHGGDVAGRDIIDNSTRITNMILPPHLNGVCITEDKARLICKQEFQQALQNWSFEAGILVEQRVRKLEDKVFPKMLDYDNKLSIFADPSFQLLIRKAQISAACSDREEDLDMLSELILHRVEQNNNRNHRLGITKAIEIVSDVEQTSLVGLSLVYAILRFSPLTFDIKKGLNVLDSLYANIINHTELPKGNDWIQHLDILSALRINSVQTFNNSKKIACNMLKNYFTIGIDKSLPVYNTMLEDFSNAELPVNLFVADNPLRENHVRWNTTLDIDAIQLTLNSKNIIIRQNLTDEQKKVLRKYCDMLTKDGSKDKTMQDTFWKLWQSYPNLKQVSEWWNSIPLFFEITPIGIALANAYLHTRDAKLPLMY